MHKSPQHGFFECISIRDFPYCKIASIASVQQKKGHISGSTTVPSSALDHDSCAIKLQSRVVESSLLIAEDPLRVSSGSSGSFSASAASPSAATKLKHLSESYATASISNSNEGDLGNTNSSGKGKIWWVPLGATARGCAPFGSFNTYGQYILEFYHLLDTNFDCVVSLEKLSPSGNIYLCAYPRWRSHASYPQGNDLPLSFQDTALQMDLACASASLSVSAREFGNSKCHLISVAKPKIISLYLLHRECLEHVMDIAPGAKLQVNTLCNSVCRPLVATVGTLVAHSFRNTATVVELDSSVASTSTSFRPKKGGIALYRNLFCRNFNDASTQHSMHGMSADIRKLAFYECPFVYTGLLLSTSRQCYFYDCNNKGKICLLDSIVFTADALQIQVAGHCPAVYVLTVFGIEVWSLPMPTSGAAKRTSNVTIPAVLVTVQGLQSLPKTLKCLPSQLLVCEDNTLCIVPEAPIQQTCVPSVLPQKACSKYHNGAVTHRGNIDAFSIRREMTNNARSITSLISLANNTHNMISNDEVFELRTAESKPSSKKRELQQTQRQDHPLKRKPARESGSIINYDAVGRTTGKPFQRAFMKYFATTDEDVNYDPGCAVICVHIASTDRLMRCLESCCANVEDRIRQFGNDLRNEIPTTSPDLIGVKSQHYVLKGFLQSMLSYMLALGGLSDSKIDYKDVEEFSIIDLANELVHCQHLETAMLAAGMLSRLLFSECRHIQDVKMSSDLLNGCVPVASLSENPADMASRAGYLLALEENLSITQAAEYLCVLKISDSSKTECGKESMNQEHEAVGESKIMDQLSNFHPEDILYAHAVSAYLSAMVKGADVLRIKQLKRFIINQKKGHEMLRAVMQIVATEGKVAALSAIILVHPLAHQYSDDGESGVESDSERSYNIAPGLGASTIVSAFNDANQSVGVSPLVRFLESQASAHTKGEDKIRLLIHHITSSSEPTFDCSLETMLYFLDACGVGFLLSYSNDSGWHPTLFCDNVARCVENGPAHILECIRKTFSDNFAEFEDMPIRCILKKNEMHSEVLKSALQCISKVAIFSSLRCGQNNSLLTELVEWLFNLHNDETAAKKLLCSVLEELIKMRLSQSQRVFYELRRNGEDMDERTLLEESKWMTLLAVIYVVQLCSPSVNYSSTTVPNNTAHSNGKDSRIDQNSTLWLEPWLRSADSLSSEKLINLVTSTTYHPIAIVDNRIVATAAEISSKMAKEKWPEYRSGTIGKLEAIQILCLSKLDHLDELVHFLVRTVANAMDSSEKEVSSEALCLAFCQEHCKSTRDAQEILNSLCSETLASHELSNHFRPAITLLCRHCLSSTEIALRRREKPFPFRKDGDLLNSSNLLEGSTQLLDGSLEALPDHANVLFFVDAVRAMRRSSLAVHAVKELIVSKSNI